MIKLKNLFSNPFKNPYNIHGPNLRKRIFNWKNIKYWGLRLVISLFIFTIVLAAWFAKDLPTPGKIKNIKSAASTQLFDRNGKPIYALHGDIKRNIIESGDMPKHVKEATITAEDRDFYRHFGFDIKSFARAVYVNITNRGVYQGGSTITQQYVKWALLDPQRTLTRKIKELILSLEVEAIYNKDQILTMYLNEIPYGSNAYGIEAAAQTYFNKHAKELTLAEGATLAAIPQRPTYYSPYGTHPDKRLNRVNYILDSMVNQKYISKDEATKAKEEAKNIKFAQPREYIVAPHFAMYVKDLLVTKYGEEMVETGGLKVTTSLDLDKQVKAEDAITKGADNRFDGINASNAALVSIDPKTGQILALVGSVDYFNNDIQGQVNVADSLRQPGSSFKPLVYAAAFKQGYNPGYTLWDVPTDFGNYTPKNYDGSTHGPVSMRMALAGSLNIPAVKTLALAGIDNSLKTAHEMGITSLNDRDRYGLSLVLGGGEVKLTDLTTAYGVFANQGSLSPTTAILKITDRNGDILEEYKDGQDKKEVLDPQISHEISSILSDNQARSYVFGTNSALNFDDRTVAVKTGTTSKYRDAWTVGYTPSVVTGVWVGNNDNTPMSAGAAGAMAAAPIFHQYMASVLAGSTNEDFTRPAGIEEITVDKLSNKLPTSNSPETIKDIFASWQIPKDHDDIHVTINIDKFTGKKASEDCPAEFTEAKTYTDLHSEMPDNPNWEKPVLAAAERYGIDVSYPPEETSCVGLTGKPTIKITSPQNNSSVGASFSIQTKVDSPTGVKKVDFNIDGSHVGSSSSSPYSFTTPSLSSGKHTISVSVINDVGLTSTDQISVTVIKNSNPPDSPTFNTISPGSGSATITWTNPSNSDLSSVRIYGSLTAGQLGSILQTVGATPGQNGSVTITGLVHGTTYWFTLKAVNSSAVESTNSTQYSVAVI